MAEFSSDGVRLHYELAGPPRGEPLVLVHGFASDYDLNWVRSGWSGLLAGAGRRVIGLDCRGHGGSEKPHDPAAYALPTMAADALRLLDHLGLARADYLGYSMGARIGLELATRHGGRLGRVVLAAIGLEGAYPHAEAIARRLRG